MISTYRSFAREAPRMLGVRDGAYPQGSVTERTTTQAECFAANPSGGLAFATSHRRCAGHDALRHRSLLASRSAANVMSAIDALISSEAP